MNQPAMSPCHYTPPPYDGLSKAEALRLRTQFCNPGVFLLYKDPVMIVAGHMQFLFDETGKRYLDMIAGIATVSCGHCHPKIIQRTQDQIAQLQHSPTIYLNPLQGQLAKRLSDKLPDGLDVTYFVNSGSEANDLAITMARLYTQNFDILTLKNSYHGGIATAMGLTALHTWKFPLPQGHGVHAVDCPDPYVSPYPERLVTTKSIQNVWDTIRFQTPGKIAGYIAETIQGIGGTTEGAPEYYQEVQKLVHDHGGLYIADEVQTGFGRTGDNFWGFEHHGIVPDIVTMAKSIGNGIPLAAVTTRREIAHVMTQKLHFNTFGGNPVSLAQGLATLDVIEEDGLQENARTVGTYLKEKLCELKTEHDLIGDVRGRGLMLGVELVTDRATRTPAKAETDRILEYTKDNGVLFGKGGLNGNVLRVKPPLCITREDADYAVYVLDKAFKRL